MFISHCRLRWHTVGFLLTSSQEEGYETPKMTSEGYKLVFSFLFPLFLSLSTHLQNPVYVKKGHFVLMESGETQFLLVSAASSSQLLLCNMPVKSQCSLPALHALSGSGLTRRRCWFSWFSCGEHFSRTAAVNRRIYIAVVFLSKNVNMFWESQECTLKRFGTNARTHCFRTMVLICELAQLPLIIKTGFRDFWLSVLLY